MFVYALKSVRHNRFYVGLTSDIERRFVEHNIGFVKSTKFYKPFELVHVEVVDSRDKARKLEKYFKSGYGKEIIREIVSNLAL